MQPDTTPAITPAAARAFVLAHAEPMTPVLVPEITLLLARQAFDIHQDAYALCGDIPFWAFAWGGGQGLARFMLDNPHVVAGKRVLDLGAGSGLGAIAAAMAGAKVAIANDTDFVSCVAAGLNAEANGVAVSISQDDLLGTDPEIDVVLIGDVFYLPDLVTRVEAFLARARRRGATVYFGDRATTKRPAVPMTLLAEYRAPLTPELEIGYVETARVWRLETA
jgi:predicted nicotinamide N-methyase